jgi:hypothetical protein
MLHARHSDLLVPRYTQRCFGLLKKASALPQSTGEKLNSSNQKRLGTKCEIWTNGGSLFNRSGRKRKSRRTSVGHQISSWYFYSLAKILGHKDLKMTQRYADLSPDFIDTERVRMDTIWIPTPQPASDGEPEKATKYLQ